MDSVTGAPEAAVAHEIVVVLNEHKVLFKVRKATGAEIKATAIQQSVQIKPDFSLFEVVGGNRLKPVGDHDVVELHDKQVFRATAPDDNS
jgi:hypothetical protein